jgi:hypothetical protein
MPGAPIAQAALPLAAGVRAADRVPPRPPNTRSAVPPIIARKRAGDGDGLPPRTIRLLGNRVNQVSGNPDIPGLGLFKCHPNAVWIISNGRQPPNTLAMPPHWVSISTPEELAIQLPRRRKNGRSGVMVMGPVSPGSMPATSTQPPCSGAVSVVTKNDPPPSRPRTDPAGDSERRVVPYPDLHGRRPWRVAAAGRLTPPEYPPQRVACEAGRPAPARW